MPLTSLALSRHGDKSYCSTTTVTIQIPPTVPDTFMGTGGTCNPVPCVAITALMRLSASSPNLLLVFQRLQRSPSETVVVASS